MKKTKKDINKKLDDIFFHALNPNKIRVNLSTFKPTINENHESK